VQAVTAVVWLLIHLLCKGVYLHLADPELLRPCGMRRALDTYLIVTIAIHDRRVYHVPSRALPVFAFMVIPASAA